MKDKKWIALFQFEDREFLQKNLNQFIRDHEDCDVDVWTDSGHWYAQIMYRYQNKFNDDDKKHV